MRANQNHRSAGLTITLVAYYSVLVAFLVGAFFPEHRVWGVNWWAYFPYYVPFVLFAIGAIAPLVIRIVPTRDTSDDRSSKYFIVATGLIVLYGLAFYLLRARTHFLGDGLTSLSYLASDNPLIRSREFGESLVHIWLKSIIGGDAQNAALLSFQIISIFAGICLLLAVSVCAKALFHRTIDRILFFLGLASGGYMLLFFGYVEHYSMFVMTVAVFSLVGLLVVRGQLSKWFIVPVLGLAIFFHALGATLIPTAIYVLLANTEVGNKVSRINPKIKLLLALLGVLVVIVIFTYFYKTNYFFQFAFVPLVANRFTVEGYTLFSINNLADFLNLLILLLPAFPLFIAALLILPVKNTLKRKEYRYLAILLLSTLGAAFIFDPKMGMPRDWDLFCFSGVPLGLFYYFMILDYRKRITSSVAICGLSIVLGFFSLIPRVAIQNVFETSVAQFEHYIALDKKKCAKGRSILMNYFYDIGDSTRAEIEKEKWNVEVPEKPLFMKAYALQETNIRQAMSMFRQVIKMNPLWEDAWANLGACYITLRNYDSAIMYIKIAIGINPYDAASLSNLATAYMYTKEWKKAEKALRGSISLNNASNETHYNLITLYKHFYHQDKFLGCLLEAASRKDTPLIVFKELGDYYLKSEQYKRSAEAFRAALQKGLDSVYVKQLMEKYSELSAQFLLQAPSHDSSESRQ